MFEGSRHVSLRSLPGMLDRCVQIGSAGKTFSLTGWKVRARGEMHSPVPGLGRSTVCRGALAKKPGFPGNVSICAQIGWVTGPTALIAAVAKAHQFITFTVPSSLQRAVAYGLDNESSFYLCATLPVHGVFNATCLLTRSYLLSAGALESRCRRRGAYLSET